MSRGPAVGRTVLGVRRHPGADRATLDAFQDALLRRLVRHAYDEVPYYRKLFDGVGLDPARIRGTADLSLIPISAKTDLRTRPASEILARGRDSQRLLSVRTSGSSGQPFTVYRTWLESALQYLFRIRALGEFGLRFSDRTATVGLVRFRDSRDRKLVGRSLAALGLKQRLALNGLDPAESIAARLAEWQPVVIIAMPTMLGRVAEYVVRHRVAGIRPRVVIVGGEVTTPRMRQRLEEAFGASVFETYASHEVPLLGWQCRTTGAFHVCDDGVILEVVRDGMPVAPGEDGEVVVTNLHAYAMPLIRYRLADLVTRGERQCACGQPFSTIGRVQGRTVDLFPLPDGRVLNPYDILGQTLRGDDAWLAQYQLLQERRDRVVLRVVPLSPPGEERLASIDRVTRTVLGPQVEFELLVVDELPFESSGKFRPMRSLVQVGRG